MSAAAPIRFDGQVALVTGAGRGLGREYALALAARGAKVVVNGRGVAGDGAEAGVVAEIEAAGGQAVCAIASVTDADAVQSMCSETLARWGRIDILVNNAGFVRDRSFSRLGLDDFRAVMDVHVNGAFNCTQAVWGAMLEQQFGRIVMAVSSSGLAGNFGQAAYSSAKMALVGFMNTLGLEGESRNVHVNCFSPIGTTRMNAAFLAPPLQTAFTPAGLVPGLVYLASRQAPNRAILMGGAGSFERAYVSFTKGCFIGAGGAEQVAARFEAISDRHGDMVPASAQAQMEIELRNAGLSITR